MNHHLLAWGNHPIPVRIVFLLLLVTVIVTYLMVWFVLRRRWDRVFRKRSHSVVTGLVNEQFAPLLKGFPGEASDARFLGKPVDYIVFNGYSKGHVDEIIFVEVKSHSGVRLTAHERSIRDAVQSQRVRWEQFNVD